MLKVTESAVSNVKEYLSQQRIESAIRVTVRSGGCAGPSLALAVDEANAKDKVFDHDGISFIVDQDLLDNCGTITVDFIEQKSEGCGCSGGGGFSITSEKPLFTGSSCGCSCSSGSCG